MYKLPTYNSCYFSGNKAFVINFLERGLLCCVCLRPPWKDLSGENIYPSQVFQRALLFNFIWCVCCYPLTNMQVDKKSSSGVQKWSLCPQVFYCVPAYHLPKIFKFQTELSETKRLNLELKQSGQIFEVMTNQTVKELSLCH